MGYRRFIRRRGPQGARVHRGGGTAWGEPLERRLLLATQTISSPGTQINEIELYDSGAFQFRTDPAITFTAQAGTGHVYQFEGSDPLSGFFVRTNGKVYGNPDIASGAIPFRSTEPLESTDANGVRLVERTYVPTDAEGFALFEVNVEVRYRPDGRYFLANGERFEFKSTIKNLSLSAPLTFDYFVTADANARGRAEYLKSIGGVASYDENNQPHLVLDPSQQFSNGLAASFVENDFYATINDKLTSGADLEFDPAADNAPGMEVQDDTVAVQWNDVVVQPQGPLEDGDITLTTFIGIDPVGDGDGNGPDPLGGDGPVATLLPLPAPPPPETETYSVRVRYTDTSSNSPNVDPAKRGIDLSTIGISTETLANDIYVIGPNYDSRTEPNAGLVGAPQVDRSNPNAEDLTVTYTFRRPGGFGTAVYDVFLGRTEVKDNYRNSAVADNHYGVPGTPVDRSSNSLGSFETGLRRLTVTREANDTALQNALIGPGSGLVVTRFEADPRLSAADVSTGVYANPGGVFGLAGSGIVVSTGDAGDFGSGANLDAATYDYADQSATAEEAALLGGGAATYRNVTRIDIDFDLEDGSLTDLFFNVVWGTEQFPGTTPAGSLDGFGLVLNGVDIARTPRADGGSDPINPANPNVIRSAGTELDGVISVAGNPVLTLQAPAPGSPGALKPTGNTLTIIIADAGDAAFASTAYISALGVNRPTGNVDRDESQAGIEGLTIARQGDGLLVGGRRGGAPRLQRFRADNSLDTDFGDAGTAASLNLPQGTIRAVAVQGDRIVVTGDAGPDVFVARFLSNGQVDTTFGDGGDGVQILSFTDEFDVTHAIAVDAANRILVAGAAVEPASDAFNPGALGYAVARFLPDGAVDTAFGDDGTGVFVHSLSKGTNQAGSIAIQPDGKLIVAGEAAGNVGLIRLTPDGVLDAAGPVGGFQATGEKVVVEVKTSDPFTGLSLQPDGKILVSGTTNRSGQTDPDFALARLTPNGDLDAGFGLGGLATTDMEGTEDADSIVVTPAGRIYVVGTRITPHPTEDDAVILNTGVALYAASDGQAIREFGSGGYTFYDPQTLDLSLDTGDLNPFAPGTSNPFQDLIRAIGIGDGQGGIGTVRGGEGGTSPVSRVNEPETPAPPVAQMSSGLVATTVAAQFVFNVTYSDSNGLNEADFDRGDLVATNGSRTMTVATAAIVGRNGNSRTVAYAIEPGNGELIDAAYNGTWVVTLNPNQVRDLTGLAASSSQTLNEFTVAIGILQAPTASFTSPAPVTVAVPDVSFVLTYTDADDVDVSTIDVNDIVVTNGTTTLRVTGAVLDLNANGSPRNVTYAVAPNGGGPFAAADNGTYRVVLQPNQVKDVTGLAETAPRELGAFVVSIVAPPSPPVFESMFTKKKVSILGASFSVSNGTGEVYRVERDGVTTIDVVLNNVAGAKFTVLGAISLDNITVNGTLKSFTGKSVTLTGTMQVPGELASATFGSLSNATLSATGNIKKLTVAGSVSDSLFVAGVNAGADGAFGTPDDDGNGAVMKAITVKGGADAATHFYASGFPKSAKMPGKTNPVLDERFTIVS